MTAAVLPDVVAEVFRDERGRAMGKYERLCWARHARDLELAAQPGGHPRGFFYSPEHAERAVMFIEGFCRHYKGEWARQRLLLEEWQKKIIRIIFGWFNANATRRFRIAYVEIARKNGKSLLAAALGLYLLIADGEEGAEVYASATKLEQAEIVWADAEKMVERSPELRERTRSFKASITCPRMTSYFKPLAADSKKLDGLNPHGNVVDELHAHPERGLWDVLQSAMGSRRQPLTLAITTAGHLDTESIGFEQHEYAQRVLDGEFEDDTYFAFIAAADPDEDLFSDVALEKANPNIDVSAKRDYLYAQRSRAQRLPGATPEFYTKHLNVWTQQSKGWIALEPWRKCELMPIARDAREAELLGAECYGGLDLAEKIDLCALVLEFKKEGSYFTICRFWLPEERMRFYADRGQRFFEQWHRDGWLTCTPGNVLDHEFIQKEIERLSKLYKIKELAFDPWKANQTSLKLMSAGVQMVECRQGYRTYSEPVSDVEASVLEGKLHHGNHPILRWCVANAVITMDAAGNKKLDKSKAKGRIDGAVALAMARSRGILHSVPTGSTLLDQGGLLL